MLSPVVSQIPEAMRGKAEQGPRWTRAHARNQADCSDNAASRACGFEVSAEHEPPEHTVISCFSQISANQLLKPVQQKPVRDAG